MVGKEWWVSRDWGLGIAAHLMVGTADNRVLTDTEDGLVHARWFSVAVGLLVSATYN